MKVEIVITGTVTLHCLSYALIFTLDSYWKSLVCFKAVPILYLPIYNVYK